jgi:hypothetical protein
VINHNVGHFNTSFVGKGLVCRDVISTTASKQLSPKENKDSIGWFLETLKPFNNVHDF